MSRKRTVSVDVVLSRSMRQFHRHGYHATSVQTLVDCTGIGRGSLYNSFHSKRRLFICALRRYISTRQQLLDAALDQPSARGAILGVFERLIEQSRDGCFVVNTSVELAPHDREIAQVVAEAFHETEQLFLRLIDQGQATGDVAPGGVLFERGRWRAAIRQRTASFS
ncbi:MAG: TetR/AcrR family transcriptional regulator [Chloroflexota bacterium]|nr:TetR/AcrR family transcriptional regulator [Chloroflexota bacterium]